MSSVALGALSLYLLRPDSAWRLGLPLAIMLVYCLIGIGFRSKNLFRFADSLYFMGFLWTILAFFSATTGKAGADEIASGQLPALFGYAVLTTGVGMFLRVAVLHGHVEPESDGVAAEVKLTAATERLVGVLHHGATQLELAIDRAETALGQLDAAATAGAVGLQSDVAKHVEDASKSVRNAIEASSAQFGVALNDAAFAMKSAGGDFSTSQRAFTHELAGIGQTLQSFGKTALKTTQLTGERWEAASEALSRAASTLTDSAARIQTVGPLVESLDQQVRALSASMQQLDAALGSLRSAAATAGSAVTNKSTADLLAIEGAMGDIRASTETIHSGLLDVVREIRRLLETTG